MKIKLISKESVASNITTFQFMPAEPVHWIAGQFIQMLLPHENTDDRGEKRWFTLSASPSEEHLAITTRFAGQKSSTFKKTLFALEIGAIVEINQPEGDFTLPDNKDLELVFIAGGIGVTPYRSMVRWLQDQGAAEKRAITLIHGVQIEDELIFHDLFKAYGVTLLPIVGERLTASHLLQAIGDPTDKLVYLSGPEPMVETLHDQLIAGGLNEDNLKADYFPGYDNDYSS